MGYSGSSCRCAMPATLSAADIADAIKAVSPKAVVKVRRSTLTVPEVVHSRAPQPRYRIRSYLLLG